MTIAKKLAVLAAAVSALALSARAQATPPPQTFSTTVYFDYTANATKDGYLTGTEAAKLLGNQFRFRRAYFTYENKINDFLKFRFRFDADNTANVTSVDFAKGSVKKDDKLRPFVKHLYLEWSPNFLTSKINVGMVETLSFKLEEDRWGLRSVAKTLLDGYKDVTGVEIDQASADIGLTWKGTLARPVRFALGVHNGSGYSHAEGDKYKKLSAQLQLVPVAGLNVIGYADYERQNGTGAKAYTYKIDAYLEMVKNLTLAGTWFTYNNETYKTSAGAHYDVSGWSVFGVFKIKPDKLHVFGRYDFYQPNDHVANDEVGLVIAGLDWTPMHSSFRLQPNVWYYAWSDSARKGDVVANLTLFMSF